MTRGDFGPLRETPIGAIAVDWEMGVVADFVASLQAGVSVNAVEAASDCDSNEVGVLKTSAVLRGEFFPEQCKVVIPEDVGRVATNVVEDRVIVSRMNTPALVGESGYVAQSHPNLFLPDRLWQTVPSERPHSQRWLSYWLQYPSIRRLISAAATGTSNSMKNISKESVLSLPIPRTPFPEQRKITAVLAAVDDKLGVIARQIDATETLKRGLMQTLFSRGLGTQGADEEWVPHVAFKNGELGTRPSAWRVLPQGDVATFHNGRAYKLSEWEEEGTPVIRLQNLTGSGENYYYSNLKLPPHQYVEKGELLYMWSASFGPHIWSGEKAIYHYHIWKVECGQLLDQRFMYYSLVTLTEAMRGKMNGSTMAHLTKAGMEKQLMVVPPLYEQKRIAEILFSVDAKLNILLARKTRVENLKLGLMQKLLTGEWRVKLQDAEPIAA